MLREGIARSPHIDGVYGRYPSGAFFHVVDLDSARLAHGRSTHRGERHRRALDGRDDRGKPLTDPVLERERPAVRRTPRCFQRFDPRTRPWYRAAVNGKAPVRSSYEMATTGNLGMTISQAHRGNPQIVIGADVVLIRSRTSSPASG